MADVNTGGSILILVNLGAVPQPLLRSRTCRRRNEGIRPDGRCVLSRDRRSRRVPIGLMLPLPGGLGPAAAVLSSTSMSTGCSAGRISTISHGVHPISTRSSTQSTLPPKPEPAMTGRIPKNPGCPAERTGGGCFVRRPSMSMLCDWRPERRGRYAVWPGVRSNRSRMLHEL